MLQNMPVTRCDAWKIHSVFLCRFKMLSAGIINTLSSQLSRVEQSVNEVIYNKLMSVCKVAFFYYFRGSQREHLSLLKKQITVRDLILNIWQFHLFWYTVESERCDCFRHQICIISVQSCCFFITNLDNSFG